MRQSELKVRANKQFWLAENVIGGRFLNHSTVWSFIGWNEFCLRSMLHNMIHWYIWHHQPMSTSFFAEWRRNYFGIFLYLCLLARPLGDSQPRTHISDTLFFLPEEPKDPQSLRGTPTSLKINTHALYLPPVNYRPIFPARKGKIRK